MNLEAIKARMVEIRSSLEGMAEAAEGALGEDEQRAWDELDAEFETLSTKKDELEARAARLESVRSLALDPSNVEAGAPTYAETKATVGINTRASNPWDEDEIRSAVEKGYNTSAPELVSRARDAIERVAEVNDSGRERVTRILENESRSAAPSVAGKFAHRVLATSSDSYIRSFYKMLATFGQTGVADVDAQREVQRAMSLTDGSGGYAIPLPIDPTLILDDDKSSNPFRRISTVRQVTTDSVRFVQSGAPTFSWDAEAAEVSDDATTFTNVDIAIHKAQGFIPFSIEIGQDYPGFAADTAQLIAQGRDNLEATAFATGSGSGQPFGIVTALAGGSYEVATDVVATTDAGDVYDVQEELPAAFSAGASWVAHKKIYQHIRELGGSSNSDFWANMTQGVPAGLLGNPVYESSAMDSAPATTGQDIMVLGDFSNYRILDRVGMSIELVPHLFHLTTNLPSGQRGFYVHWRVGADSVLDRAFRLLTVA